MDKHTIARALEEIADFLDISESNPFKSGAFRKAAQRVEEIDGQMSDFVSSGAIKKTPGIGKATGAVILELIETGKSEYLEQFRAQYPPGIFEMQAVPGLGLKKIAYLYETSGIGTLEELEMAGKEGKLASMPGFGAKTQQKILEGIEALRNRSSKFLLPLALDVSESLKGRLESIEGVEQVHVAGAVRRRLEVVDTVELCISTWKINKVIKLIESADMLEKVERSADTLTGFIRSEIKVELHLVEPEVAGWALLRATGSSDFLEGLALVATKLGYAFNGSGVMLKGDDVIEAREEDDCFRALKTRPVPPELRETAEWIGKRPKLVSPDQIRGAFHVHTTWSDGGATMYEMLDAARQQGLGYVGISDHSPLALYARGLTEDRLIEQQIEIEKHRPAFEPMRIFKGTEADILSDGAIDYGHAILPRFDFVIASIHSRFKMEIDEMTERMLTALRDPFVTFLGHMTGRKLLSRDGYTLELDRVFEVAAEEGVIIEINGNPHRLDIDWRLMRRAASYGVLFSVNPDAHSTHELLHVVTGTWSARKGGLAPEQIFNTWELDAVEEYLAKRKARAMELTGAAASS